MFVYVNGNVFQVKQFYFFDAGEIPPPVIMVQHVSFRYNENTVIITDILYCLSNM